MPDAIRPARRPWLAENLRGALISAGLGIGIVFLVTLQESGRFHWRAAVYGVLMGVLGYAFCAGGAQLLRDRLARARAPRLAHALLYFVAGSVSWILANWIGVSTGLIRFQASFGDLAGYLPVVGAISLVVGLLFYSYGLLQDRLRKSVERLKEAEFAEKELEIARAIQQRILPPPELSGEGFRVLAAQSRRTLRRRRLLRLLPAARRSARRRRRRRRGQGHGREPHHGDRQGAAAVSGGRPLGRGDAARGESAPHAPPRAARVRRAGLPALRAGHRRLRARQRGAAGSRTASRSGAAARPVGSGTALSAGRALRGRLRGDSRRPRPGREAPAADRRPAGGARRRRAIRSATSGSRRLLRGAPIRTRSSRPCARPSAPGLDDDWTALYLERTSA